MSVTEITTPKFRATDGSIHPTRAEAEARGVYLDNQAQIEAFILYAKLSAQQAGAMRKLLPQYMIFDAIYVPPVAVPAGTETTEA